MLEGVDARLIPAFVNAFLIDALGTFPLAARRETLLETAVAGRSFRGYGDSP